MADDKKPAGSWSENQSSTLPGSPSPQPESSNATKQGFAKKEVNDLTLSDSSRSEPLGYITRKKKASTKHKIPAKTKTPIKTKTPTKTKSRAKNKASPQQNVGGQKVKETINNSIRNKPLDHTYAPVPKKKYNEHDMDIGDEDDENCDEAENDGDGDDEDDQNDNDDNDDDGNKDW